eukprot:7951264-Pyramimonas_sp.AAC.1
MLPRLLLHHTSRGGEAGERELRQRIAWFDTGRWDKLPASAHHTTTRHKTRKPKPNQEAQKLHQAQRLTKMEELSHAARVLSSS